MRFLLVAIDYFTKWVEAEALATITEAKVQNFVWKNIVYRFGIPRTIISDNGRHFDSHGFKSFCSSLGIKKKKFIPRSSSGQWTEKSNKPILAKDHQSPISGGKGRMTRGITKRPMGLKDHNTNANRRDAFQSDLGNRSSHPSRGRTHKPQEGVL